MIKEEIFKKADELVKKWKCDEYTGRLYHVVHYFDDLLKSYPNKPTQVSIPLQQDKDKFIEEAVKRYQQHEELEKYKETTLEINNHNKKIKEYKKEYFDNFTGLSQFNNNQQKLINSFAYNNLRYEEESEEYENVESLVNLINKVNRLNDK